MSPKAQKLLKMIQGTPKKRFLETQIVMMGYDRALNELLQMNRVDIVPDPDSKKPPGLAPGMVVLNAPESAVGDEGSRDRIDRAKEQ